ncbi:MAG: DNA recombination/repair protein RecA, partial [Chloroflexota bacterium]|nr:DNA recombination/repair protein RecA [Chloroflexota bacterium]
MQTDAAVSPSLANALETLRSRGLALRRGSDPEPLERARPSVSSGYSALDAALGTDGWPRGALALLDAPAGSGATTLALR